MGALLICVYAARLASDISTDRTRLRFIHGHLSPGACCNPGAPDGTDGRPECRRTRNKAPASSSKGTVRGQPIAVKPAKRKGTESRTTNRDHPRQAQAASKAPTQTRRMLLGGAPVFKPA